MAGSSSYRPAKYYGAHSVTEEAEQQQPFFSSFMAGRQNNTQQFFQAKPAYAATNVPGLTTPGMQQEVPQQAQPFNEVFGNTHNGQQPATNGGDGNLNNPRFKGDQQLEDCLDHKRLFATGSSGNAVAKIQSGISDYFTHKGRPDPLPVFGADGQFGSETRNAVVNFQQDVGFEGKEVDGVIGHNTMDKLDKEVPAGDPPGPLDDPKPEPKDPDEACMGCKPLMKITKKNTVNPGTTTFGICDDTFDVFNTGAGTPVVGPGCVAKPSNKTGNVTFNAGKNGIGWQETADLHDCTSPPPKANAKPEWEVGFIQTLETATYGAEYGKSSFTSITNKDARDALGTPPAPWYGDKGTAVGPQEYPTMTMINDTPHVTFGIAHPTSSEFLKSVCMKGTFHIWLIINKLGAKPTVSNVDFLHHWDVTMNHKYLLGEDAHPCNQSQWTPLGRMSMSKGTGKGGASPVWDQPIANGNQVTDNKLTSSPCAASSNTPSKDQPKDK